MPNPEPTASHLHNLACNQPDAGLAPITDPAQNAERISAGGNLHDRN
jgi:hypothetical protein